MNNKEIMIRLSVLEAQIQALPGVEKDILEALFKDAIKSMALPHPNDHEYIKSRVDATSRDLRDLRESLNERLTEHIEDISRLSKKHLKATNIAFMISFVSLIFSLTTFYFMWD